MEKQLYDRNDSIFITRNRNGITVENLSNILNSAMCTPTENKGMIFTDDKGKEYRFEQEGLNVWRSHFDDPQVACEAYRQNTENLKSYMQRQWSLVGGMAGTFREME